MDNSSDDIKLFGDIKIMTKLIENSDLDGLRDAAISFRDSFATNAIILIAMIEEDKVQLAVSVTDDLTQKYPAGKLVGIAAKLLGGGGGGKPHLATAGGKDVTKLPELMETFSKIVENY